MATTLAPAIPRLHQHSLLGGLRGFNRDRLGFLEAMDRACPRIGQVRLGPSRAVVTTDPAMVQDVLVTQGDAFGKAPTILRGLRLTVGDGLLTLEGERHRRHRRLIAPSLTPRHIAAYADTMVDYAERRSRAWSDGATLDVVNEATMLTMEVATKTLFDADISREATQLGRAIANNIAYLEYHTRHIVPSPLWWPSARNRHARRTIAQVNTRVGRMIAERRADPLLAGRDDLLSRLVQARDEEGAALTDAELLSEIITLFGAGHETTAKTLSWAIYELCRHPRAYALASEEITTVLGDRPATLADLPRLPYTSWVIKESLRLYPPAYLISRAALRDVQVGGYILPRGTLVFISAYTLHRRPDYYPDPLAFRPERFAGDLEKTLPRHAYLPFGAGAHICIGSHFALMEAHLLLVTLLRNHDLTLRQQRPVRGVPAFVLAPDGPIQVTVRRRSPVPA